MGAKKVLPYIEDGRCERWRVRVDAERALLLSTRERVSVQVALNGARAPPVPPLVRGQNRGLRRFDAASIPGGARAGESGFPFSGQIVCLWHGRF